MTTWILQYLFLSAGFVPVFLSVLVILDIECDTDVTIKDRGGTDAPLGGRIVQNFMEKGFFFN